MNILKKLIGTFALTIALTGAAQANLIQNGSFEDVGNNALPTTWSYYASIPNWDDTQNVEIWKSGFNSVIADDLNYFLELNAHGGDGSSSYAISQNFATIVGATYELNFAAQKRSGGGAQAFEVSVGDTTDNVSSHVTGSWTDYTYTFTALSALSTLSFTSLDDINDSTGNFFDDVSITEVSTPNAIALMLFGLVALVVARKKTNS
ncbi:DUF642 domain-containing protein [Colwellia sp. E2M01]|uniref:DUF642 domain-containing protein n=1 Tax=Colwellia sp. E2M01 TaxID=2841561 RepID=UPI001C098A44|nr:DUF642 domain-containing protein [Colwellia sp. E2M01]MBU2871820.1 DUF642 domain-containing protein [Colwellia sp. E2M01]